MLCELMIPIALLKNFVVCSTEKHLTTSMIFNQFRSWTICLWEYQWMWRWIKSFFEIQYEVLILPWLSRILAQLFIAVLTELLSHILHKKRAVFRRGTFSLQRNNVTTVTKPFFSPYNSWKLYTDCQSCFKHGTVGAIFSEKRYKCNKCILMGILWYFMQQTATWFVRRLKKFPGKAEKKAQQV